MMTYEEALKAIEDCYDNRDYSIEEALENMKGLVIKAEEFVEALQADLDSQ